MNNPRRLTRGLWLTALSAQEELATVKRSVQVEQDALAKQHSDHLRALRLKEKECADAVYRAERAEYLLSTLSRAVVQTD